MIPTRGLDQLLACVCLAVGIGLTLVVSVYAGDVGPEAFLGPRPGIQYAYSNGKGMHRWFRGVEKARSQVTYEDEICCFGPYSEDGAVSVDLKAGLEMTPILERKSIRTRCALVADESRLVMKSPAIETVLFDTTRDEWKAPMISSPGMPKEGICRIVSKKREAYRGEDRLIVTVSFNASLQGEVVHEETWTLASGIGVIALGDFKLIAIEKVEEALKK
ncbi:MAG: hypothetical protein V3571_09520 [Pseudodesulfovibrio sp.]